MSFAKFCCGETLGVAVVPLHQIRIDVGATPWGDQLSGFSGALEWAAVGLGQLPSVERSGSGARFVSAHVGERYIGASGVLPHPGPLGFPMANNE